MAHILRRSLYLSSKIKICSYLPCLSRTLTNSKSLAGNYEGDGKTTVTILNREQTELIMIDSYSNFGFRLNNGIFAMGPIAVFPKTLLQWNVNNIADLTVESLSLFCLLEPKLDILVIGTGDKRIRPCDDVIQCLKSNGIHPEVLQTHQACTTFNFLNMEGRCVAGAIIPPTEIAIYSDEMKILENCEAIDDYSIAPHNKIME